MREVTVFPQTTAGYRLSLIHISPAARQAEHELGHAHAEGAGGEVVARLVDEHEGREQKEPPKEGREETEDVRQGLDLREDLGGERAGTGVDLEELSQAFYPLRRRARHDALDDALDIEKTA